ncbi:MAG: hypothetical protein RL215_3054 [Planctomycetota bacterium]
MFEFFEGGFGIAEEYCIFDAVGVSDKVEPGLDHVHDGDACSGEPREFERSESDGSGADDESVFAVAWVTAFVGVAADGECFDECELFVVEV